MNRKKKIKMSLDILITIALLFQMAFQVTGDKYHEWLGAGMVLLFLIHNGLNWSWYKAVFKGKYNLQRILRTVINLTVLISITLTGYSGIVMSKHVFAFLPMDGGMATARKLHLAGSYWSFVLMSIHLGMHWSVITGKMKVFKSIDSDQDKKQRQRAVWSWVLRIAAFAVAIYGAVLFGRNEIFRNMFLQNDFAILDYETPGVLIILQNLSMMSMWILVGYYLTKALVKFSIRGGWHHAKQNHVEQNRVKDSTNTSGAGKTGNRKLESHYDTLVKYLNLEDCGKVLGKGCKSPSMTKRSAFMDQAYALGKSLGE